MVAEEQAEPVETHRSGTRAIRSAAVAAGKVRFRLPAIRAAMLPFTAMPGISARSRSSRRSRRPASRVASSAISACASRHASPRPTISGAGRVPERRPRSCPPPENSGGEPHARPAPDIQRADALRTVDLVAADRGEIDLPARQVERDLAGGLGDVGVEQRAGLLGDRGERGDVLHHADLVVHRHDADQQRRHLQRGAQHVGIEQPVGTHRQEHRLEPFLRQVGHRFQHAFVLGRHGDDAPALVARTQGEAGGALDRDVVALGGAGGEHQLLGIGADQRGDLRRARPRPRLPPRCPSRARRCAGCRSAR